jgi:type IV secretion system protein TrbL
MNNLNIIDQFLATFVAYINSGFGLLGGDVRFLVATLIGIDITLAGLFWALGGEDNVLGRLIRKILYVGAFAFVINNFSLLADIILWDGRLPQAGRACCHSDREEEFITCKC